MIASVATAGHTGPCGCCEIIWIYIRRISQTAAGFRTEQDFFPGVEERSMSSPENPAFLLAPRQMQLHITSSFEFL